MTIPRALAGKTIVARLVDIDSEGIWVDKSLLLVDPSVCVHHIEFPFDELPYRIIDVYLMIPAGHDMGFSLALWYKGERLTTVYCTWHIVD